MICTGCTFVLFIHYLIFLFGRSLLVLFLLVLSFFTPTPLISFTSHPMLFLSLLLILCYSCLSFSSYALPVSPSPSRPMILLSLLLILWSSCLSFSSYALPVSPSPSRPMILLSLLLILCSSCLPFWFYVPPVSPSSGGNGASPDNLLALAVIAARERASLGEISFALETEWGRHVATTQVVQGEIQLQNILIKERARWHEREMF